MKKAVCFGEVLWDVFPDGKKAGGAPMNVAFRLQSLGYDVGMISRIGEDENGSEILEIIDSKIPSTLIQKDEKYPTGVVAVTLDAQRNASYEIVFPSAWDFIDIQSDAEKQVSESDVLVFGSLVCRHSVSKETLYHLLSLSKCSIFDVNLRAPFYDLDLVTDLMKKSSIIKMNDDELKLLSKYLSLDSSDIEKSIHQLAKLTETDTICITRGENGALLYTENKLYQHPGFKVNVEDTVGAGDSFLAAFIHDFFENKPPEKTLEFACAMGSLVASKKGATPEINPKEIQEIIQG